MIKYKCADCKNEFYYFKGNWVPVYCPICGKTNINIIEDIDYHTYEGTGSPLQYNTFTGENPFYRDSVGAEG